MADGGISEAVSEKADGYDYRALFEELPDNVLQGIVLRGTPESKSLAITILNERDSKPRRGRPRAFKAASLLPLREANPDVYTDRGMQNKAYAAIAMRTLMNDSRFAWVCDIEALKEGRPKALKHGILAELGRFLYPETIKMYAERICELRPKTKNAITMLRRARTGNAPTPSCLDLTGTLTRVIDDYMAAHPGTDKRHILMALENARDAVESAFPDEYL